MPSEVNAVDISKWMTAAEALAAVDGVLHNSFLSIETILESLRAGRVTAIPTTTVYEGESTPSPRRPIRADDWLAIRESSLDSFWVTSNLKHTYRPYGSGENLTVRHFNVRFHPHEVLGIIAHITPSQIPEPSATSSSSKGGAPRKEWWDDFWIEICFQIYDGKLIPKRQADLERAMLDWATEHGHDVSEATIRKVAKKLFVRWDLGG